jgi:type II secretory pathway pseudopilin PulG
VVRVAFTLIELIFAIVVIGIAVISMPTVNQVSTDGMEKNILQEAIFMASAELNQAVSANWDDNSYEPGEENTTARVIDLIGDCNNNPLSPMFRQRQGQVHRRCLTNPATGVAAAPNNLVIDFNDLAGISTVNSDNLDGYKNNMTTTIAVNPAGGPSLVSVAGGGLAGAFGQNIAGDALNIKQIQATIVVGPDTVILNAYSCNIGEIDYEGRSF